MTDTPISPLRRRMIEDMTVRKFAARTQEGYIRAVKNFSAFLGASPDKARFEDVRRYRLHLASSGTGVPTINHSLTALRFLFMVTLRQPDVVIHVPFVREPRRLPVVLSPVEVARLLEAAPGLKYRAALSVAYGAGLLVAPFFALVLRQLHGRPVRVQARRSEAACVQCAALAERDDLFGNRPRGFGLGQRSGDALVQDEAANHVREHRIPMLKGAAQFGRALKVSHNR